MSGLNALFLDLDSLADMTDEELESVGSAANDLGATIQSGIAAIGSILAGAATNEDAGINMDSLANLGYLLHGLGNLSLKTGCIEKRADNHKRHRQQQGVR